MKFKDQLNRIIHLKDTPKRIISLVPSQTELLCDLGLKDSIVGVTKFCVHPYHIKTNATIVGGTKQIHIDEIKTLNPDIILCNKEENTKDIVEACELICAVHVSDVFTIEDSLELINKYGVIFNKPLEANSIVEGIKNEAHGFKDFIENRIELNTVYFIWRNPWMVAGKNAFIDYVLQLNKLKNSYETENRYPKIKLDNSTNVTDVDIVLLPSEPYPFKEKHIKELQTFYPKATVMLVDGELFSWYGSRLTKAFEYFKSLHLNIEKNQSY